MKCFRKIRNEGDYIFLNPTPVLQNKHLIIMLKNAITSVENKKLSADNFLGDSFVKPGRVSIFIVASLVKNQPCCFPKK